MVKTKFKDLIKELFLPCFWLFFIVVFGNNKAPNSGVPSTKEQVSTEKRMPVIFTKYIYIKNQPFLLYTQ